MTTENLDIRVRERGAKKAATNIKGIGTAAKTANKGIALMTAGIAGLAAIGVARKVIGLANSFVKLENQIKVSIKETESLTDVMDQLFAVADRTKQPIEAIATLFQRSAIAQDALGASTEDLIGFSEAVSNALRLQGASAETAAGALLQLSQAIGNSTVRAEEFNSIIDGAPTILQAAAKGIKRFDGDVAALRNEVVKGTVSSKEFFDGILSQAQDLEKRAAKTSTTVDQALTRINNAFIQAAGGAALDPLTDSLDELADLISDPAFQEGFATFVSGVVTLASFGAKAASETGLLFKSIGVSAAALFNGLSAADELQIELDAINRALDGSPMTTPIRFTFKGEEELERMRKEVQAGLDLLEFEITGVSVADREARELAAKNAPRGGNEEVTAIDPKLLAKQKSFLDGLRQSNAELEIQARLGDAAADGLARYATEQEIIALQLGPEQVAQARALTEAIIGQNKAIADQAALGVQTDFIESLEAQEQALIVQGQAGEDSANAMRLYNVEMQAAATGGGPEFVKLALDIAQGINDQTDALERQAQVRSDADVVQDLLAEAELIGLSNRERAVEVSLRRLSADATQDQIDKVRELAGELFDEGEALRRAGITFDEFLKENARAIQQTLSGALSNAMTDGFDDLPSQFAKVLQQLASQYLASGIFKALSGIGQGDGAGALAKGFGDFFAGGFATGGDFKVPGSGGVDSQLVSFKATPGENVSVRRPGDSGGAGGGQAPAPQVNVAGPTIVNAIDPSDIVSAFNDGGGDKVILNMISVRQSAFKRALGV